MVNREINALDYKSTAKPSQEHQKGRCSSSLPMKWSDGQRTGDENAPTAALGCPNIRPGIFAPDIITKNFTFGTFVRAVPCQTVFNIKSYQYKQFTQNKTIETKFHSSKSHLRFNLTVPDKLFQHQTLTETIEKTILKERFPSFKKLTGRF